MADRPISTSAAVGRWARVYRSMSARARRYQEQVTGRDSAFEFELRGVFFDGLKSDAFTLVEAKSFYKQFINRKTGEFKPWFKGTGGRKLVAEYNSQLRAAGSDYKLEWRVAEKEFISAMKGLLRESNAPFSPNFSFKHSPPR